MGVIVFPGDIAAEMKRTQATANAINIAVNACAGLDTTLKAEWTSFYQGLSEWDARVPGWFPWSDLPTTANAGDSMLTWEKQLLAWQQRLAGYCPSVAPSFVVFTPTAPIDVPPGALSALRYIGVAIGIVAIVWGVSKVVPLIPSAKMRAANRRLQARNAAPALKA